jgi:hypothetical protein
MIVKFDPSEARDECGRWTDTGKIAQEFGWRLDPAFHGKDFQRKIPRSGVGLDVFTNDKLMGKEKHRLFVRSDGSWVHNYGSSALHGFRRKKIIGTGKTSNDLADHMRRLADPVQKEFDPSESRDESGKWTTGGGNAAAQGIAEKYMHSRGETYTPLVKQPLDEDRAAAVAAEFDKMQHTPNEAHTKMSYQALADETLAQYHAMQETGIKVEAVASGQSDPYKDADEVARDVAENKHMWYYPTTSGFGSGGADNTDNPLLADSGIKDSNGRPMLKNDVFRVVHDYFGHVKDGNSFRPDGEENAWRSHSTMFSPLARRAMTTETRAQNAWVYFGPYGAQNRAAKNPADVHFADQKVGLLPEDFVQKDGGFGMGGGATAAMTTANSPAGIIAPQQGMFRKPRRSGNVNIDKEETTRPGDGGSINPLYGGNAYILAPGKTPRVNPYESLLKAKKAVAIDFDGTITLDEEGTENPRMYDLIKELQANDVRVVIFTARPAVEVFEWLVEHEWPLLEVTNVKSPDFGVYLDDRALNFAPGMAGAGLADTLAGFKAWWEKSATEKDATSAGAMPDNAQDEKPPFPAFAITLEKDWKETDHPRTAAGTAEGGQFSGGGAVGGGGEKPSPTEDQARQAREWNAANPDKTPRIVPDAEKLPDSQGRQRWPEKPVVAPLGGSTQAEADRLDAANAAWREAHPGQGIGPAESPSTVPPSTEGPQKWDDLARKDQAKAKENWMNANRDEFVHIEVENWKDNPDNFEDVPKDLSKDGEWTEDKIKEINDSFYSGDAPSGLNDLTPDPAGLAEEARRIKEWRDNFAVDDSIKNGAFTNPETNTATDADGKLYVDTDKLVFRDNPYHEDTGQQMLPGIERADMEKAYNTHMWAEGQGDFEAHFKQDFDEEVTARVDKLKDNPPPWLADNVDEFMAEHWDQMDDSEKLKNANAASRDRDSEGNPGAGVEGRIGPNAKIDSPEQESINSLTPKSSKHLDGGITGDKKTVTMASGEQFVWKPSTGETRAARAGIPVGQSYQREVATYDIGRLVGMKNFMPIASIYKYEGVYGSMTAKIPNAVNDGDSGDKNFVDSALRTTVLDYVIGNADRHGGNWMTDNKGKFWAIDHGLVLSEDPSIGLSDQTHLFDTALGGGHQVDTVTEAFLKPWRGKWSKIEKILKARGISAKAISNAKTRYDYLLRDDGRMWSDLAHDRHMNEKK